MPADYITKYKMNRHIAIIAFNSFTTIFCQGWLQ